MQTEIHMINSRLTLVKNEVILPYNFTIYDNERENTPQIGIFHLLSVLRLKKDRERETEKQKMYSSATY